MMQALATSPAAVEPAFSLLPQCTLSPAAVRQAAVDMVARNQVGQALALIDAALVRDPDSQELLSMAALICEVQHDWSMASMHLERLVRVQGNAVTAETLCHWVRVLRCLGQVERAFGLSRSALALFPEHPMLDSEYQTLSSIVTVKAGV